eukprot:TRINITY_DN9901_c1_g2_i1.p2 TRINITY_DN9901_c1_g2~~TRINITY_DN9901_c1_g2_i1.p2  ORF type:complete len:123 (+),score=8.66 TRINITY_DN9901_c1_g2_i1:679-1047(+)
MMLVSRAQHVERIRCKLVQDQSSNALRVGAAHASASAAQASADEAKHTDQADGDSVSTSSGVTSCCICLEEFEQDDMLLTLPCGHSYHRSCIEPWLTRRQRTCPLCKRDPFPAEDTPLLSQA